MVLPTGKVAPGLWLEVRPDRAQLSCAVGAVQVTTAEQLPESLVWAMLEGMPEITGSSSSVMVTVKEAVAELPSASVAV